MWDYIKRNKGKLVAASALMGGGIYALNKASNILAKQNINEKLDFNLNNDLLKHRKKFLFESYQDSCDKILLEVISLVKDLIVKKFNVEKNVDLLKTDLSLMTKDKLCFWEDIKIQSLTRILAVAYCYSFVVITLKVQKLILCREIFKNFDENIINKKSCKSFENLTKFITSFFVVDNCDNNLNNSLNSKDNETQELFNNCIQYFIDEGLDLFCDQIYEFSKNFFSKILLTDKLNVHNIQNLLKEAVLQHDVFGHKKNFSRFVVPNSKPKISSLGTSYVYLHQLLNNFCFLLECDEIREMLKNFVNLYLDCVFKNLKYELKEEEKPFIKIIPILTNVFIKISSIKNDSSFKMTLVSTELYNTLYKMLNK